MSWLIADIGGTNTRCAIADDDGRLQGVKSFRNRDYASLETLLAACLARDTGVARPSEAVIAVAAPILGDVIEMTNIDWTFSITALAEALGLRRVQAINDFAALALALPVLDPREDIVQIGGGASVADAARVVVGPGTGLGAAGLVKCGPHWQAMPGQGGHVTLPAFNDEEWTLVSRAREQYGHCSAERLLSGAGLAFMHSVLAGAEALSPEAVGARIDAGEPAALGALEHFFRMLGSVAADLALSFGALGGVYIGGGIVPRYLPRFRTSGFRQRFEDKGRYGDYLAAIPTFVITAGTPALKGLAALARSEAR